MKRNRFVVPLLTGLVFFFPGLSFAQEQKELQLKWKADSASESYRIELSDSSDFKEVLRSFTVGERQVRFSPEKNERYIRIIGIGKQNSRGEPSEPISLDSLKPFVRVERKPTPNDKAIILSPAKNERIVLDNPSGGQNGIRVFFRVNEGEWREYQGSIYGLQEGKNNVEFYSETASGVKETTRLMEVVQDTMRPEIRARIGKGIRLESIPITRRDQFLILEISDLVSGVFDAEFYFLQNGKKVPVRPASQEKNEYRFTIPDFLEDGSFAIHAWAKDQAGNSGEDTFFGILDSSPPFCRITPQPNRLLPLNSEVQIQCEDLISGMKSIDLRQNGGEFRAYAEGMILEPGKHRLEFRITDQAGNSSVLSSEFNVLNPSMESKIRVRP